MEAAIASWRNQHPDRADTFSTTWYPFYLNPDAPKQGVDKQAYYRSRFGEDRTGMMFTRLAGIGSSVGINFKFGGKTGNTRDSHRLVQLGKLQGPEAQTRVVEELFRAYFENEQDITSHEVLAKAGVDAGLDRKAVQDWLAGSDGGPEVDREVRDAKAEAVSGVPFFTINDKFHLEGAQDPSAFIEIFDTISRKGSE
jgi:predicted DsbA family dithiol-disulfide isomerase